MPGSKEVVYDYQASYSSGYLSFFLIKDKSIGRVQENHQRTWPDVQYRPEKLRGELRGSMQ